VPTPEYRAPIETRLVNCLRVWRDNPQAVLEDGRDVEREIYGLLEWYICECIQYGPNNLGGWWSDGVIFLEISEPETDRLKLIGVTWIDCHGVAPFEIDVEMGQPTDDYFAKTIFRIGMLDDQGRPEICDRDRLPSRLLEKRPRYNPDWAMAVELTPPDKRDRTNR
jgi:hypothetical protein